ncbi:MAG: 50S ribosomal protein L17 [Nitrospirae bacterium CG18_big_fil_WC_8_21_14_2_50_70_55]|nr:50S ribosomal protein L17 [Deltaproteobacteria bacterium]OIP67023.1 MAG: 50S ribosomal protein L17 [Nitrospirae bacterium CG2_30_70_394]PIQ07291.1 MAG: 50S ribosomal protein L17 [Nitrospirae bacterium CG18_big_fil_WC_8_21_14_2_50_70_55]PIU80156.1 MAG: 50S ribosomal protein L17 [Nitrospirae bacterium CG06_land_8_20_14_3_00_70_43]PIW82669.1 MAG: 50S ribosomal protein L17 [Nitrospirae bacterium CG_4_8_14_3_um_filter_70_85]PIX84051.1 MAG: 50S ribosomal protein L17 [Nitrospirae bacterium CG_4_10
MRHNKGYRKLSRNSAQRRAMLRNMVTSLIDHGRITVTVFRAKELRSIADRMMTLAKRGDLASRRRALAYVMRKESVYKLFDEMAAGYQERSGGYTRVLKVGRRHGDAAPMAIIEFVEPSVTAASSAE